VTEKNKIDINLKFKYNSNPHIFPCFLLLSFHLFVFSSSITIYQSTHLHICTLTYSTVQSPSWETTWFAASQEIPSISRKPKVHYRTHKRPPHVSILGQSNSVHIITSHLLEFRPNIIYPSTPRSPLWSLSLRFPHQDPIRPLSSPIRGPRSAFTNLI